MSRVVVIGAGVGGLAAAARLAVTGHDVTVYERGGEVGGKLGLYQRDGFRFDTGPSLLTLPQVFDDLFAATGEPLESLLPLQRVEPLARYRFADGTTLDATADRAEMSRRLDAALGAGRGAQWESLLRRGEAMWAAVEGPFLSSPLHGARDLLRQAVRVRDLTTIAPQRTLRGLSRRYLTDPRLRMLADRYATYSGSDPRRAPAALAVIPYVEAAFGAWYVPGGLYRLAEALRDRALEAGAALELNAGVRSVTVEGGRVRGVMLDDGRRLPAEAVVANVDAARLYADLLPQDLPPVAAARRRLRRATPSLSGFVVLLAVRGRNPDLVHHNVLFPSDYDAEFDDIFGPRPRPVTDPTLYVSIPADPQLAPPGYESWFVLVNAPRHGPVDWDAPGLAERYADHVVDLLRQRGVDGGDRVLFRCVISPADLERRTGASGGAIYGTSSNGPLAAFLRPANRSPIAGLYLVGGSSHPGGGLPLVALSAQIVSDLIGGA